MFCKTSEIERLFAKSQSRNLLFCDDGPLLKIACDTDMEFAEDLQIACIAEIFIRWVLNPDTPLERLESKLSHGEIRNFKNLFRQTMGFHEAILEHPLWISENEFAKRCENKLISRLQSLFRTDGFFPVFSTTERQGYFLPFCLEPYIPEQAIVSDIRGTAIPDWEMYAEQILGGTPEFRCIVMCQTLEDIPFSGPSMMLPLQLAVWRKQTPEHTQFHYDPLKLLATGSLEGGKLHAVEIREKAEAFSKVFKNAFLILPTSSNIYCEDRNIINIREGIPLESLKERIRIQIEANNISFPTIREAETNLSLIEDTVQHDNISHWQILLNRIDTNLKAANKTLYPEIHLLCLMLKSAVYCHMGKSFKALEENKRAQDFAEKHEFIPQTLRLKVEQFVSLQDVCDFELIHQLTADLQARIDRNDSSDLKMRFYGTMGQINACEALLNDDCESKELSLSNFHKALFFAKQLDSVSEMARDLNYIHLWHAYFCPGTPDEEDAFQDALNFIRTDLQLRPKAQMKNLRFLYRQKMFALYRAKDASDRFNDFLLSHEDPETDWLYALSCKYAGALCADKNKETSAAYFEEAVKVLPFNEQEPILALIRISILAEGWKSLSAESYRTQALNDIQKLEKNNFSILPAWRDFLNGTAPFPGSHFWY